MLKLLRYFLIKRKVNNPLLAARIYQMIYHPEISVQWEKSSVTSKTQSVESKSSEMQPAPVRRDYRQGNMVLTERHEIEQALRELQNKPKKSVADRTSIGMLEAVLANM
jgi:hypothetical protein